MILRVPPLPFKANADHRHHIPRQRRRVANWRDYDVALRQRGSLTVWFTEEAIAGWRAVRRTTRGGQPNCSSLAILTALTLRAVFRPAFRQTEGLIGSVIRLLGLTLAVPDHTTLCRRSETLVVPRPRSSPGAEPVHLLVDSTGLKLFGAGEWLIEKRGGLGSLDSISGPIGGASVLFRLPRTSPCRRARLAWPAQRPRRHPPNATAIFASSLSTDERLGRKRPDTTSAPASRRQSGATNKTSATGCARARTAVG
jgi:hypothetical protein